MSRVGKVPIVFDSKIEVNVTPENEVVVKGAKATESVKVKPEIKVNVEGNQIIMTRANDERQTRAMHGLYRALVQNAVTGVSQGWTKSLELKGVGYRSTVSGKKLELSLGFSHPITVELPDGVEAKVDKQTIIHISGSNKEKVGQIAAQIRNYRKPEPYLGKGVRYLDEQIRRKAGKSGGK